MRQRIAGISVHRRAGVDAFPGSGRRTVDTKLQLSTGLITFGRRLLKFRLFEMENFLNVNLLYGVCALQQPVVVRCVGRFVRASVASGVCAVGVGPFASIRGSALNICMAQGRPTLVVNK